MQGHDEIVWAVEIHGQQLFSASADKTIRVWDIASKRCERVSGLPVCARVSAVDALRFSNATGGPYHAVQGGGLRECI